MLKPFTAEGRFECGLDALVGGKVWAFTAIIDSPCRLGIAIANERGYTPIPLTWCHSDCYDEMNAHVDELNEAEGIDRRTAALIVASSMMKAA